MSEIARAPQDYCYPTGLISVEQARTFILQRARPLHDAPAGVEHVGVAEGLGRVLAGSHSSSIDVPGYANSQMDGYAFYYGDLSGSTTTTPLTVTQRIAAGGVGKRLGRGEAARIFTGAPLPEGADTVVMQERCERDGDTVLVPGDIASGENVRPRGNDIQSGAEVLCAGMRMRPQDMALAASVGIAELAVVRRLRVAIFSSGDELVGPGEALRPGQIYNSNRYAMLGLLSALGCETHDLGTVEDSLAATEDALLRAASVADVVVTSGGMSVGEEDHLKAAVENVGRLDMWRVAVKPGKPLAYGSIGDADFLGLPGNPVSTLVTFCLFVRPFLLTRQGVTKTDVLGIPVRADFAWPRARDRREFARAQIRTDAKGDLWAELYHKQGSDVMTSTVWADGLVELPEGVTIARGDRVNYLSFEHLLS